MNLAPNTLIGKIEIDKKVYRYENIYNKDSSYYERGGEYIENLITDNFIEFAHRWFGLASFSEFLEDMDEFYNKQGLGQYSKIESNPRSVLIPTNGKISPITFTGDRKIRVVTFYNKRNPEITYNKLIEV